MGILPYMPGALEVVSGHLSPGTEVTDNCEPVCGWVLGTEPRSLQEQLVPLTAEPSL